MANCLVKNGKMEIRKEDSILFFRKIIFFAVKD